MMYRGFKKRQNLDTFIPEVLIADKWISMEALVQPEVFTRDKYLQMIKNEYGLAVRNVIEQETPDNKNLVR